MSLDDRTVGNGTLVNGEPGDQLSVRDRGFLYGQSLFETLAVSNGRAHLIDRHLQRLAKGCQALGIPYPSQLKADINTICESVRVREAADSNNKRVLRVTLSMGRGGRGYANPAAPSTTRVLSMHDYPDHPSAYWHNGIECGVATIRLAQQPAFAGLKHGNRLEQIMARSQWPSGRDGQSLWQEALMLDQAGSVIEGTQSNVFILNGNQLSTPKLDQSGIAGVMRETILSMSESLGVQAQIVSLSLPDIERAEAVFLSNSVIGVWPVRHLNNTHYKDVSFAHKLMKLLVKNEAIPTL